MLFSLFLMAAAANAADPGDAYPATSEADDQKAGSLLYFNAYTSDALNANAQNTVINLTNTNPSLDVTVHLFFVDGSTCSVADFSVCLSPNATTRFVASEIDPGISGYIVALAVDGNGLPRLFNFLIGDEFVKYSTGHAANLGAVSFTKLTDTNVVSSDGSLAGIFFDGLPLAGSYNRAPRVLAVDNIPDRASGNDTLLILNRVGGNLGLAAAPIGNLVGLLFNDTETGFSFSLNAPSCQFRSILSSGLPRTAPRFDTVIPAGRSGWMKLYSLSSIGILGAVINNNTNPAAPNGFKGGHNLHALTLTPAATLVIPVFPPNC
jgi:hypothetical protein